ncbi:MAG: catalase [Gemmatimonadaceae bacterium]|nr:catalase [Gemmatimonadaceae bacterium]
MKKDKGDRKPAPGDATPANAKVQQLAAHTTDGADEFLTTNTGVRVNDDQNSLKAGDRGPTLLEDFIFREKMTHFDHERIPERIVHARGAGAHGIFKAYPNAAALSRAAFLQDPSAETPVFVRFSTVAGSRGSTDLPRDARGFAVKFYTSEGTYDLVGNNIPVFFIQDAMKFPDLVHAVKPEPHNEIPQATAAHDTFWDFISVMPESLHMIMWAMSDRAIPRSLRMMEGFGVHTFRLIDAAGTARFVKFHWKPLLGLHQVVWEEAQVISGADPDFHRRDLWEAIEEGHFPEWELGVQVVEEADEHAFDFDLLDPTKIIPEELVPVQRIGKMTLNRNPDNFFAETEQAAFHPGHVVPGIDFSNDPLLQGRLFSYTDTQLLRLGGPNFQEIPINRPVTPVHNNQRDGHMRQTIDRGRTAYGPNTLARGCPMQARAAQGGFVHHAERIDAHKVRARSPSFHDHYSQATLFFNSQTPVEQQHMIDALKFELGKVETIAIRERMLVHLSHISESLAKPVAEGLGLAIPAKSDVHLNMSIPADTDPAEVQPRAPKPGKRSVKTSPALSMTSLPGSGIRTRRVAVVVADGTAAADVERIVSALEAEGAMPKLVAPSLGTLKLEGGGERPIDFSFLTTSSALFDAVFLPGGKRAMEKLVTMDPVFEFVRMAYRHLKPIGASGEGVELLSAAIAGLRPGGKPASTGAPGIITAGGALGDDDMRKFVGAIEMHRFWDRV